MNLVIIHYHLNRGGVTQVILNHLRCLAPYRDFIERVVVLYGGRKAAWPPDVDAELDVDLVELPSLEYDELSGPVPRLASDIGDSVLSRGLAIDDTLLHIHNHSLGKNVAMPGAVAQLAGAGFRILLQIHDFAEDLRPTNYAYMRKQLGAEQLAAELYPQAEQIHYGALNSRDLKILASAGVNPDRLHWIPNPAYPPSISVDKSVIRARFVTELGVSTDNQLLVYPVRAIGRKNIGEALLWAALGEQRTVGVTLAPLAKRELVDYNAWVDLAQRLSVDFRFNLSSEFEFAEVVAAADGFLTTSVAEGFGMVFLESYLAGQMIWGRDLPEITVDFREAGVSFPELAPTLPIPASWIDLPAYADELRRTYARLCRLYDSPVDDVPADRVDNSFLTQDAETVDFGRLTVPLQRSILEKVASDAGRAQEVRSMLDSCATRSSPSESKAVIGENRRVIQEVFGEAAIGQRLLTVYNRLLASAACQPVSPLPNHNTILSSFLSRERLVPLRLGATFG